MASAATPASTTRLASTRALAAGTAPASAGESAATPAGAPAGNGSPLDRILHDLARPAPSTTPFIEARFSPMLTRPLVVSGELEYRGPGSLARIVREPYRDRAEIQGDSVTLQRGDQPAQHFSLDRAPEMRSLVASFSALLSGNVAALRSEFALDLHGDERSWTIGLTPLDPRIHQRIRSILVSGASAEPRCLTTFQANDDTDVMLLADAAHVSVPAMPDRAWFDAQCRGSPARRARSNASPQR
jgi:hypothetical protein